MWKFDGHLSWRDLPYNMRYGRSGMNNGVKAGSLLRFGAFELDPATSELRKNGALVKLQSQQFQLLALLVVRANQVVSREEIRRTLWGNETFVDFDRSINFCVNQIRRALDDDPQSPRYIETLPRQGYRFIAPIAESGNGFVRSAQAAETLITAKSTSPKRWWLLGTGLAIVVAIALLVTWRVFRDAGVKPITSLAVLPLENLSNDPDQDYFADGMTEDLITDLAKISALRVLSRTSVIHYKRTKKPIPEIARELNVDAILEGTVTRDNGKVRITAQLIRAVPEKHLWADRYEGNLSNVLALQDSVAKTVAHEIQIKLTPREQAALATHRSIDPVSYELYLKGQHLWEISGEPGLKKSREYFEQAIDRDPGYALAWAGLADAYVRLASWGVLPRQEAAPRARAAAKKALELDDSLPRPLVTLAETKMNYEWDWAGAEQLFKRTIELNPNYAGAHAVYATYLAAVGRTDEALFQIRKAHELEPLSNVIAANLVWQLYLARRYKEADSEGHKQFGWESHGSYIAASLYLQTGRPGKALDELRKGVTHPWVGALELMYLGHALGVTGARAEGEQVLQRMLNLTRQRYIPPEYFAIVYEGLGERDRAIQWFEKAYAERSMNAWLLPDPRLDNIRSDPRFKNILRRMGLPQ